MSTVCANILSPFGLCGRTSSLPFEVLRSLVHVQDNGYTAMTYDIIVLKHLKSPHRKRIVQALRALACWICCVFHASAATASSSRARWRNFHRLLSLLRLCNKPRWHYDCRQRLEIGLTITMLPVNSRETAIQHRTHPTTSPAVESERPISHELRMPPSVPAPSTAFLRGRLRS